MTTAQQTHVELPVIPDKRYFLISEAAYLCGVKTHVLRYWEQEFACLSPAKRRGGRRYYMVADVLIIRQIRELLYDRGFTIQGARAEIETRRKAAKEKRETSQTVLNSDIIAQLKVIVGRLKES